MALVSWCPQCLSPVSGDDDGFSCDNHGSVMPLWRAPQVDHEAFSEVVTLAAGLPTYVPWPLSPGWTVADVACVARPVDERGDGDCRATVSTAVRAGPLDGGVAVTVVTEEPGVGLGARISRTAEIDPGTTVGDGPAAVRLRIGSRPVPMWAVPSAGSDEALARSVFAGESGGRWLWLVMTPGPSALLLLLEEWVFADAGRLGPAALEMPFGGRPPPW